MNHYFSLFLTLVVVMAGFSGCKSSKTSYTPDTYPDTQLVYGKGGGFAGTVQTYYLLKDGSLFQQSNMKGEITPLLDMQKSEAKDLFKEAEGLELATRSLNTPGNMYAFIEWRTPDASNRIVWDAMADKAPADLRRFHQRLMELAQPIR